MLNKYILPDSQFLLLFMKSDPPIGMHIVKNSQNSQSLIQDLNNVQKLNRVP